MKTQTIDRLIEQTEGIVGGKPRIAGRRISVQHIVIWHEHMGKSIDEIATEHDLSLAEVYAVLAYYYDNQSQILASIEADRIFVEELRQKTISKVEYL